MKQQLVYWRRVDNDHVYAEYKDCDYQPEPNPLDKGRPHGQRYFSKIMRIYEFELQHTFVDGGDEGGY